MIVHVPETATAPQLLVWAKLPLVVTLLTMSVVLPLLVRVTVLAALVVLSACPPKFKSMVERLTIAIATDPAPKPDKRITCGLFEPLSVTVRAPRRGPVVVGVNFARIEQFPEATMVVQLLVCEKSPVTPTFVTDSELVPAFVTVTVCVALDVPVP